MIAEQPEVSIELGSWYLNELNRQFRGNPYKVIAAYNAGPGTVNRWLSDGTWDGEFRTVSMVPYGGNKTLYTTGYLLL